MPIRRKIDGPPVGIAASWGRKGESIPVITREFTTSDLGAEFYSRLHHVVSPLLPGREESGWVSPSMIDHLVAIIDREGWVTVYINEIDVQLVGRAKVPVNAGAIVTDDHLADIIKVELPGVKIPNDAGVVILLSGYWRKGLFFDFNPLLAPSFQSRDYCLDSALGGCFAQLLFQNLFQITEEVWDSLFQQQWFPFVSLKSELTERLIQCVQQGRCIDEWYLSDIVEHIENVLPEMRERWTKHEMFKTHQIFIERGVDRFVDHDYISTISILYPRIEGLMRSCFLSIMPERHPKQKALVTVVSQSKAEHDFSRLLPERFREYLYKVFFASFTPNEPATLSRNSLAHGVASPELFSKKAAVICLLLLDHIFFLMPDVSIDYNVS